MDEKLQFEAIAILRAYAQQILDNHPQHDLRPSSAAILLATISKMHNVKDRLTVR